MSDRESGTADAPGEEFGERVIEAFISAVGATLQEMAQTPADVRGISASGSGRLPEDIIVLITLHPEPEGQMLLGLPTATATALAGQILGAAATADEALVRDCSGEIANVVAGQAKTLLAETPYHFTFSTPKILTRGEFQSMSGSLEKWPVITFSCDAGDFTVQVRLPR